MDFSKCLYDPHDKGLVKNLSKYEEFTLELGELEPHRTEVFRFVVMMYDLRTPLRKIYPDHNERKREAAFLAGFKFNKNKRFKPFVEDGVLGLNEAVAAMVARYVILFGIPEYSALVGSQSQYAGIIYKMIQQTATKDEIAQHRLLLEDIYRYETKVYGGAETLEMRKALYVNMESRLLAPKPEAMAQRLKDNPEDTLEEFNPYGRNYRVKKLKFKGDGTQAEG